MKNDNVIKDLGDGLILRRATTADADELATFNAKIHSEAGPEEPDEKIGAWVRDLMTRPHPTTDAGDFTVIEDTHKNEIISSMNYIPQTWSYEGIEFGVGRPELVGTNPEYRKRGLVRAQFDIIHQWSAERGHKVQAITGIPYYYRQFGYEMCLELDGGRIGYLAHIPKLEKDQTEAYRLRPVVEDDLPLLAELYEQGSRRYMLASQRDEQYWRYDVFGKSDQNVNRSEFRVIETTAGEPAGFLAHSTYLWGPTLGVRLYELKPGVTWLEPTYSVLRYLKETGQTYANQKDDAEFEAFAMWFGTEHPVYQAIDDRLPRTRDPYAWFIRLPDMPDFLRHIQPVLEDRLAKSIMVDYSGDLKLSFFRKGINITFEEGKIKEVSEYVPESTQDGDVLFPDLTFLRVLFGSNSFCEIEKIFADCYARNDIGRALVPILFPKKASHVRGIS